MKHLLLNNASNIKKISDFKYPAGYTYDKKLGAWVDENGKDLMINHPDFIAVGTKKFDIETGEDHKGN